MKSPIPNPRSAAARALPSAIGHLHSTGLPPLAEQHRIVAKVDELMTLCDRLEAQLTTTQTQSRCLLESTLHQALNGKP